MVHGNNDILLQLYAERNQVIRFLQDIPEEDIIDKLSFQARLNKIDNEISLRTNLDNRIKYQPIVDAINYYSALKYEYIDVPWLVSDQAYNFTCPDFVSEYRARLPWGNLVASGEQSFIQIIADETNLDRVQCTTPCFRPYDGLNSESPYNLFHFMKVELFQNISEIENESKILEILMSVINQAKEFFQNYIKYPKIIQTSDDSYDIICSITGIELGSYGIRKAKNGYPKPGFKYIYGTGLAEPRLSHVIQRLTDLGYL
jgi:hypothetical protein